MGKKKIKGKGDKPSEQPPSEADRSAHGGDYIRSMIECDVESEDEAWDWLAAELAPGMLADESEFIAASAKDVIRRNRQTT